MPRLFAALVFCLLTSCGLLYPTVVDPDHVVPATRVDLELDRNGRLLSREYHVAPGDVPLAVREAMDRLHPASAYVGARVEYTALRTFYQLARQVDGLLIISRFQPDGTLLSERQEIPLKDVPETVRQAVLLAFPRAARPHYEQQHNALGETTGYQVRIRVGTLDYRLSVNPTGLLLGVWRDIPSQLTVPASPP